MDKHAPDTSSISFTALYTGQVWVRNGLSEPFFQTRSGALLYGAMSPMEALGKRVLGGNIRTFLLQRHHLIDARLEALIEQHPDLQVVEIACGLSPRGCRFRQRFPSITYVEADLPDMADRKRRLLAAKGFLSATHRVAPVNILAEDGPDSVAALLDGLDPARPVAVITEGLINYFSLDTVTPFWGRLAAGLRRFPRGVYLSDNYPLYANMRFHRTLKTLGGLLGAISRSQVAFHFRSDADTERHFLNQGFDALTVHDPADFYTALPIPAPAAPHGARARSLRLPESAGFALGREAPTRRRFFSGQTMGIAEERGYPAVHGDRGRTGPRRVPGHGPGHRRRQERRPERHRRRPARAPSAILDANQRDLARGRDSGLDAALLDRLELTPERFDGMVEGLEQVIALADPVGGITDLNYRPSGIQVGKMRVPLGVIGIIYESRPNVTIDAAALCLKSGNAAILRGGSEAIDSNQAIAECLRIGLREAGLPETAVQVIETTDRAAVGELITHPEWVDVIVPRGGKGLIERISNDARVPVIKHLDGNCHVYIDAQADAGKAIKVAYNAKTQRYGTCNTMETLLVHAGIAERVLPELAAQYQAAGVELRGCERSRALLDGIGEATETDWAEEYLAPVLAIKLVDGLDEALEHIHRYSSGHTESIITQNYTLARRFLAEVDSSSVMVNASTRFADGFEYGLGAEIGISTDKLHARGPVGLEGLTSQKWVVLGDGHVRT